MNLSNKLYHLFESPKLFGSIKEESRELGGNLPVIAPLLSTVPKKRAPRKKSALRKKKTVGHCGCSLPDLPEKNVNPDPFEIKRSQKQQININKEEK